MDNKNYSRSILVERTPSAVFDALTKNIGSWWTMPDKPLLRVGDIAKFTFPPGKSYWTFKATVLDQDKRVEMQCIDALHIHEGQPKKIEQEWLSTKVVWQIEPRGSMTQIQIEHIGLVPKLLCYEVCEAGWDFFFVDSLKEFLDSGKGRPHAGPVS